MALKLSAVLGAQPGSLVKPNNEWCNIAWASQYHITLLFNKIEIEDLQPQMLYMLHHRNQFFIIFLTLDMQSQPHETYKNTESCLSVFDLPYSANVLILKSL